VAGGEGAGADPPGPLDQQVELDEGVAPHARRRRATGEVIGDERIDDVTAELLVHPKRVVRNAGLRRHPAGVAEVERAAAAT
jgi:hypothetical protein